MTHTPLLLPNPRRIDVTHAEPSRADLRSPRIRIDPQAVTRPQGYVMDVGPQFADIVAHDGAGAFYARQTLEQLQRDRKLTGEAPCLRIEDWPDFPHRGVMLDISRDRVPTMQTLLSLVDVLGALKVNELQLYTEHTFAYRGHEEVWRDASPMTPDEVRRLDAYCRERFIDLVPNQNTFGHMERWLKHERYLPLAAAPEGSDMPWGGRFHGGFSLDPLDPRAIALVEDLLDQLLPNFSSTQVNIGCDETFDVGQGKRAELVKRVGEGRVYVDFLKKVLEAALRRGRKPQFWGDIIIAHPELIGELPRGVTAMSWGYEASFNFEEQLAKFASAGVPYYVCPGTSSWLSFLGRTDNALGNLRAAADAGARHGAVGFLNTDWGDHGHWQSPPISYLPFAYGAAISWNATEPVEVEALLQYADRFIFRDAAGVMARAAYDLGNAYRVTGVPVSNNSALHLLLRRPGAPKGLTAAALRETDAYVRAGLARMEGARMDRPDADLVLAEFGHACELARYACRVGLAHVEGGDIPAGDPGVIEEFRGLWLARSRPGGLEDSVAKLRRGLRLEPFEQ